MEMREEKLSVWARGQGCFMDIGKKMKKLAQDDPRVMVHSLKFGLALTLVSIPYYLQPTYDRFRFSSMWAVMTVTVVFEFSVGATLGKVINTVLATSVAVPLGVGVNHLARLSGHTGEPILLALFIFVKAVLATFLRFCPEIKARYDYGLLIFILTFATMSVSGFRDANILDQAYSRLTNMAIGCCICAVVSLLVCPVWAGHDLHDRIANNIRTLATFLEGLGSQISGGVLNVEGYEYDSVLKSEAIEESLVSFASWEPGHDRFKFRHPWELYQHIGALIRQCAHKIEALNSYRRSHNIHTPPAIICREIQEAWIEMSLESGRALNELATAVRTMTQPPRTALHVPKSDTAVMKLVSMLQDSGQYGDGDRLAVVSVATAGLLLIDVVRCAERIADSVRELASHAGFEPKNGVVPVDVEYSQETKSTRFENDAVQCLDTANCSSVISITMTPEESSGQRRFSSDGLEVED